MLNEKLTNFEMKNQQILKKLDKFRRELERQQRELERQQRDLQWLQKGKIVLLFKAELFDYIFETRAVK